MFRIIRQINATIQMANDISAAGGDGPRWSLFLTNRSFIAQVIATLFAVMGIFGVMLPIEAGDVVEIIAAVGFLGGQAWALYERVRGKTRTVWNTKQANLAVVEAVAVNGMPADDKLTAAIAKAVNG